MTAMAGRGHYAIATTFGNGEFSIPGPDPVTVLLATGRAGAGSKTIVAAKDDPISPQAVSVDPTGTTHLMFTDKHGRILIDERAPGQTRVRTQLNAHNGCGALPRLISDADGNLAATWFCERQGRAFIRFDTSS
jgi:hypothetical protein